LGLNPAFAFRLTRRLFLPLAAAVAFGSAAGAQVVLSGPPTVGSPQPVSPEPAITRPTTTPCKVPLFTNAAFNNYNNQTATFTPPSACPGPWAKVIFTADFTVSTGRQFDRSSEFFIGNATLFRGTTAEPSSSLSPSWHVESDATDLSALLGTSQTVVANIGNTVDSTYTGIIYANAELDFYPADGKANLAATVPDQVIPLVANPTNPVQSFASATPFTVSVTLPKNTTELYMDVISQPDEFWWLSTPNATVAPYIQGVNQTALREIDVSIDGKPAGIAPNHPYVFTGGIDPYLWRPIPASQTLHLMPYRINLTPFAGALSDGNAHTIVINDINTPAASSNPQEFGVYTLSADLLVYTDHGAATTTGLVSSNTLTVNPGTSVTSNVNLDGSGNGNASVTESLQRSFAITGFTNTSTGRVTTTVAETVNFSNSQQLTNLNTPVQNVVLDNLISTVDTTVTTSTPSSSSTSTYHTENPLQAFITFTQNTDGTFAQTTTATVSDVNNQVGPGTFSSNASESVMATDSLAFDSSENLTGHTGAASTGTYNSNDSLGNSYSSTLTSAANVLTGATINAGSTGATLFVSASATTVAQGGSVTLTATAIPFNSTLVPTGRITFYSNGGALSIINLSGGTVSVPINFTHVGANVITATYDGDNNFLPESSMNPLTITVTPVAGSFTVGPAAPTTLTLSPGSTGVVSVPVTSGATFGGVVALTCSGAPSGATCLINPTSVTLVPSTSTQVSTQTVSVVVTTTATVAENHKPAFPGSTAGGLGGISIAGLFFIFLPRRKSKSWRSMTLTALAVCALGLGSMVALTGCGSGSTKAPAQTGTPAGNYTITVTGTSGTLTSSTTFSLTVN
jgi:Peptide N-acetyl-beta-D-glucosaminyl asparaginase amidase A/Bacterial Ig-like domain (group 3)